MHFPRSNTEIGSTAAFYLPKGAGVFEKIGVELAWDRVMFR